MKVNGFLGLILAATIAFKLGDIGEPRSSYDMGSAGVLKGSQVIVNVFADTLDSKWSVEEVESTALLLKNACEYIENQGMQYGQNITFIYDWNENPDLEFKTSLGMNISLNSSQYDEDEYYEAIDRYLALIKRNLVNYDRLIRKYNADGVFMILHFNVEGRSYAISFDGEDSPKESVIMYNNVYPSTYAHEILHLYGAHDYYEDAEYTEDAVKYIKRKYPDDIMLTNKSGRKISNSLGFLTAYHLGWIDVSEDINVFSQFER